MVLSIDLQSDEPIYQQIRSGIVLAVATGELAPGDALPSVRSLASDLGVNMHTVNKAYAVLRDEGYVAMRGRSVAFIADTAGRASPLQAQAFELRMAESLYRLALEYRARGGSEDGFIQLTTTPARSAFSPKKEGE